MSKKTIKKSNTILSKFRYKRLNFNLCGFICLSFIITPSPIQYIYYNSKPDKVLFFRRRTILQSQDKSINHDNSSHQIKTTTSNKSQLIQLRFFYLLPKRRAKKPLDSCSCTFSFASSNSNNNVSRSLIALAVSCCC